MKRKQLQLLLALLITAATGAWAQSSASVYSNDLDTPDLYKSMTKIDANGDGTNGVNGCWVLLDNATYNCSPQNKDADDWLVTPGLVLEAGVTYTIALEAWKPTPESNTYKETFEVKVGTDATAANLSDGTQVIKTTEVTTSWTNYHRTFTPTTSGTYYVGIHATSPANQSRFSIRNLVVGFNYYTLSLADDTKDAGNWKGNVNNAETDVNLPITKLDGGEKVTLKYNGHLKVKAVTATHDGWNGDLANIPASLIQDDDLTVIVPDGTTLTGTLNVSTTPYKVVIPDGATVKLDGVSINGVNKVNYMWAGITCLGDATIILSGTNTVKGFFKDYPGIQAAAAGKTLIINGTGSLTASSYGLGAGIGGKRDVACGDIEIQGGTITATSGSRGAGIGGGDNASCGNITISGGTVNATGGVRGAGIGGGRRGLDNGSCGNILISGGTVTATGGAGAAGIGGGRCYNSDKLSSCGTITITTGVTKVTATKGENAPYSIGAGTGSSCGTIIIGCTLDNNGNPEGGTKYWEDNAPVGDGATYLAQDEIVYPPSH